MQRSPLARLLSPRSIAVIGGREAVEVIRQCDKIGFDGPIYPVNPRRAQMEGRKTYASVADLPLAPDASFIAVPRAALIEAVAALAQRGAGGAVCYAAGFAETGPEGAALERELVARSGDMALTGPNCYGHINYLDGAALWPDQHGGLRVARGVAIVTQSGNIGQNLTMQKRSLPLAYLVTVGNKAKGDMADYIDAFLDDDRVTAIGLHIEGLGNIPAFDRATARARARGVPIVVVKTGRSSAGAAIALSHTASLAGEHRLYDALFARQGVACAPDLSVFLETLKLLHVHGQMKGRAVSSMSCSGGEASLAADLAAMHGLTTPPLPEKTQRDLAAVLGPRVILANPLDYHTYIWGDQLAQTTAFTAMLRGGFDMNLLVLDFPRTDRCEGAAWEMTMQAFAAAQRASGAPAALVSSLPEALPEAQGAWLIEQGVAPMQGLGETFAALGLAAGIGEAWARQPPLALRAASSPSGGSAKRLGPQGRRGSDATSASSLAGNEAETRQPAAVTLRAPGRFALPPEWKDGEAQPLAQLDEHAAKQALAAAGLRVPAARVAALSDVAAAARAIGFPVVVKALSAAIAHKTEAGGVALNLATPEAAESAAHGMAHLSPRFLVEQMLAGAVAELIVGVSRDPQFGLTLTLGAGGVLVELLNDTATLLLPATRAEVSRALASLRIGKLLRGRRGRPAGDIDAAVDAVMAIARYAETHWATLVELDVNPLLVMSQGEGAVAADALIRIARPAAPAP